MSLFHPTTSSTSLSRATHSWVPCHLNKQFWAACKKRVKFVLDMWGKQCTRGGWCLIDIWTTRYKTNEHFNIVNYIWWCILCYVDRQEQKVLLKLSRMSSCRLDKYVEHTHSNTQGINTQEVKHLWSWLLFMLMWLWLWRSEHQGHCIQQTSSLCKLMADHYSDTQLPQSPLLGCVLGLQLMFWCNYQTFDMTNYCPTKPSPTSAKELNLICRSNGLLLFLLFFSFCF